MSLYVNKSILAVSFFSLSFSAFADSIHNISSVVTPAQASNIVHTFVSIAPSGTSVSDISVSGTYTLDDSNSLKNIALDSVSFYVRFLFFSSTAKISISADFIDGDCSNPVNIVAMETGTNSLIDKEIKSYISGNSVKMIKEGILTQSSLYDFCKVKPRSEFAVSFY